MKVLFWGSIILCLSFFMHLLLWRTNMPKTQNRINVLFKLFLGNILLLLPTLWLASPFSTQFPFPAPALFSEYLHIFIFYNTIAFSYIGFYKGIEVSSPSLSIVLAILKSGENGLEKEAVERFMTDNTLIKPKLQALVQDRLVSFSDGKYILTSKGQRYIWIIYGYRKLLKLPAGG